MAYPRFDPNDLSRMYYAQRPETYIRLFDQGGGGPEYYSGSYVSVILLQAYCNLLSIITV